MEHPCKETYHQLWDACVWAGIALRPCLQDVVSALILWRRSSRRNWLGTHSLVLFPQLSLIDRVPGPLTSQGKSQASRKGLNSFHLELGVSLALMTTSVAEPWLLGSSCL